MRTPISCAAIFLFCAPAFCADWNPRLAADYLDARQKEWFSWAAAKSLGGPCISCHTGMTYLFARPALRRVLGESAPTQYESGLLAGLRARVARKEPKSQTARAVQALGVESIFAALFVGQNEPGAFDRLWALQQRDGAWPWFNLDLNPWELDSDYFGAALAAMAAGEAREDRPEIQKLRAYLEAGQVKQPLQNRLMLLWASTKMSELLTKEGKGKLIAEAFELQQPDGGWTLDALGPWRPHAAALPSTGSNAYATAFISFVVQEAGVKATDSHVAGALGWLRSHQDRSTGAWPAHSMNKQYPAGSMEERFMQDTATSFAAMALTEQRK